MFDEEFKYSGDVDKDKNPFGKGIIKDGNGITISGTWLLGKQHGCSMF